MTKQARRQQSRSKESKETRRIGMDTRKYDLILGTVLQRNVLAFFSLVAVPSGDMQEACGGWFLFALGSMGGRRKDTPSSPRGRCHTRKKSYSMNDTLLLSLT